MTYLDSGRSSQIRKGIIYLLVSVSVLVALSQTGFLVLHPTPDPMIEEWAASYLVTSSIQFYGVALGALLAAGLLILRDSRTAKYVLMIFSLFVFWFLIGREWWFHFVIAPEYVKTSGIKISYFSFSGTALVVFQNVLKLGWHILVPVLGVLSFMLPFTASPAGIRESQGVVPQG